MFEGLLGQVKEGLQKWGDSFTDTQGIFQGGRDARAFGRLRDFAEGQSFQTPGTEAGGYTADTPFTSNPYRSRRRIMEGEPNSQVVQGPWQNPLANAESGEISYPQYTDMVQSRFAPWGQISKEQNYDEGMQWRHEDTLKDLDYSLRAGREPSEDEKRAHYYEKYNTYHPNFISKFLASRLWD